MSQENKQTRDTQKGPRTPDTTTEISFLTASHEETQFPRETNTGRATHAKMGHGKRPHPKQSSKSTTSTFLTCLRWISSHTEPAACRSDNTFQCNGLSLGPAEITNEIIDCPGYEELAALQHMHDYSYLRIPEEWVPKSTRIWNAGADVALIPSESLGMSHWQKHYPDWTWELE